MSLCHGQPILQGIFDALVLQHVTGKCRKLSIPVLVTWPFRLVQEPLNQGHWNLDIIAYWRQAIALLQLRWVIPVPHKPGIRPPAILTSSPVSTEGFKIVRSSRCFTGRDRFRGIHAKLIYNYETNKGVSHDVACLGHGIWSEWLSKRQQRLVES